MKNSPIPLKEIPEELLPLFEDHFELKSPFPIKGVIIATAIGLFLFLIMKPVHRECTSI